MSPKLRRFPSPALVISAIALILALGGSAIALAPSDSTKDKEIAKRVANKLITKRAVSLSVSHAATADNATHAVNADNASNADQATNAAALGGSPPSDYRVNCPNGMGRVGSLCYDQTTRPAKPFAGALQTCARAGLRLPDAGELALIYDRSDSVQPSQWVSAFSVVSGVGLVAGIVSQDTTRTLTLQTTPIADPDPFRCVGGVTN